MVSTPTSGMVGSLAKVPLAQRIGGILLVATLSGTVATVVWASRRGFDLTDEGYYLQLYARPQEGPPAGTSQFNRLVDLFDGTGEPGILVYRLAGLLLLIGAATLLATSIFVALGAFQPEAYRAIQSRTTAMAFIVVAGLMGFAWLPLTLSYNTLSAVLAEMTFSFALLSLSFRNTHARAGPRAILLEVLAGTSMSLLLFVKWPTAALTFLLVLVLSVGLVGWRESVRPLSAILGSFVVSVLLISQVMAWFSLDSLLSASRGAASSSHDPSALLALYLRDLRSALLAAFRIAPLRLLALVALLSGGLALGRLGGRCRGLPSLIAATGGLYLLLEVQRAEYLQRSSTEMFIVSLVVAATLVAILAFAFSRRPQSESSSAVSAAAWLAASLLAIPLAVSFGTNNPLFRGSLVGAAGYGGSLVVILSVIGARAKGSSALHFGLALPVVALVMAAQITHGVVVDPYRLPTSRVEQTEPVRGVHRMRGILLDPQGARFIEEVHSVVNEQTEFQAGDRVLAFAKLPGLVYILDGVGPGDLWINPPETGLQVTDCDSLRRDAASVARTRLILQNDEPSPEFASCLEDMIPGYPQGFSEVARIPLSGAYGAGTGSGNALHVLEFRDDLEGAGSAVSGNRLAARRHRAGTVTRIHDLVFYRGNGPCLRCDHLPWR